MEKKISLQQIADFDKRYRTQFINSLTGFKSVNLVGTVDKAGNTNLSIFSQVFHLGANPSLIGLLVRPDSVPRHTLTNIEETGFFTLNHITESIYKQAHQSSARYPKEISEFDAVHLTVDYKDFKAPYVAESPVKIGLALQEKIHIQINDTILVIGAIQEVYFDDLALAEDGFLDLEKLGSITVSGLDSYHKTTRLDRLSYAKPGTEPKSIL